MKITSKVYSPILIKYPVVKWIIRIISIPIFATLYLLIPFILLALILVQKDTVAWILPLIMMLMSYLIPYIHLRNGWASKQILELENINLTVTNKWFLFTYKKKYNLKSLNLVELEAWNLITGQTMKFKPQYSKLVINDDTTLHHFYKQEDIEKLINQYKITCANNGEHS